MDTFNSPHAAYYPKPVYATPPESSSPASQAFQYPQPRKLPRTWSQPLPSPQLPSRPFSDHGGCTGELGWHIGQQQPTSIGRQPLPYAEQLEPAAITPDAARSALSVSSVEGEQSQYPIDLALEPSASPSEATIQADVFIYEHFAALAHALSVNKDMSSAQNLALWPDASFTQYGEPCGYAMAMSFQEKDWNYRLARTRLACSAQHGELLAISLATDYAVKHAADNGPGLVRIFSDCQGALRAIAGLTPTRPPLMPRTPRILAVIQAIADNTDTLTSIGWRVEFHWVPRNLVDGNRIAASVAKYGRLSTQLAFVVEEPPNMDEVPPKGRWKRRKNNRPQWRQRKLLATPPRVATCDKASQTEERIDDLTTQVSL